MIEIPSVFFIRLGRLLRVESEKPVNSLRREIYEKVLL